MLNCQRVLLLTINIRESVWSRLFNVNVLKKAQFQSIKYLNLRFLCRSCPGTVIEVHGRTRIRNFLLRQQIMTQQTSTNTVRHREIPFSFTAICTIIIFISVQLFSNCSTLTSKFHNRDWSACLSYYQSFSQSCVYSFTGFDYLLFPILNIFCPIPFERSNRKSSILVCSMYCVH